MDDVIAKADAIHQLNCKFVWADDLRTSDVLIPLMHRLLVEAAGFSACHWDRIASSQENNQQNDNLRVQKA
jgi:hypothetical protein